MPGSENGMTPSKPYLLRALHEWILDNKLTPHIIVDVEIAGIDVPGQNVQDGRLVLNVSPLATRDLELGNDAVSFQARFSGAPLELYLPMPAVLAIYARENGQGMMFSGAEDDQPEPPDDPVKSDGPVLRVIK